MADKTARHVVDGAVKRGWKKPMPLRKKWIGYEI
jgi:hypothetical protein